MTKIGVKAFPMHRGKRALLWSGFGPWSPDERGAVMEMMEGIYKTFVTRVAEGRGKSYDEIHTIAQGRVWTGADALEQGLIDGIGGLDVAVAEARKLGGVDAGTDLEIYPPEPTLLDLVTSFGVVRSPFGIEREIARIASDLGVAEAAVVEELFAQLLLLRDTPVLTAWFFPAVIR